VTMEPSVALDRLHEGLWHLNREEPAWDRRQRYLDGDQDMPYAPPGVNAEYESLQVQSIANWLSIAMLAPLQRMSPEGFATGRGQQPDQDVWEKVWQANSLDSRAPSVFSDMMVHKRGIMGVWPLANSEVRIRPENGRNVYVAGDPEDPWTQLYAVKRVTTKRPNVRRGVPTTLVGPDGRPISTASSADMQVAWVHDHDSWRRFERSGDSSGASWVGGADWVEVDDGTHALGHVAFVPFDNRATSGAVPRSDLEPLIPMQDAINTIRFQTLLAMQFSAYRQRIVVGYDPVARDATGAAIPMTDPVSGLPIIDPLTGLPKEIVKSPGRPGVDRLLVFPGELTKVFDMPESNMDNYVKVLGEFLTQFFAVAQVPPQYLLSRMANLSGDALTGAESTLNAKVKTLQTSAGESLELVMRMASVARGKGTDKAGSEVLWGQSEVRSFAATVDAVVKLISQGMAPGDAWAMLPGATPPKIDTWVSNAEARAAKALAAVSNRPALPGPGGATPPPGSPAAGQAQLTQTKPPAE
jgi:hypothetical protein